MKTELMEAMAAGVLVEVRDSRGNTIGQALFTEWRGRPLPGVGDLLCCTLNGTGEGDSRPVRGEVVSRQFDVQLDDAGELCVWVLIIAEALTNDSADATVRPREVRFSEN
jgi:hypothetical protein